MTRFVVLCVALVGPMATTARAAGMLPNNAATTFNKVFITENGEVKEPTDNDTFRNYFNLAHCICSQSNSGTETTFEYELTTNADTGLTKPVDIWIGTNCNTIDGQMK